MRSRRLRSKEKRLPDRNGSVFILSVWIVFLFCIFAIGLGGMTSSQLNLAEYFQNQPRARYLAEAAIKKAALILSYDKNDRDTLDELWSTGKVKKDDASMFQDNPLGEGTFSIYSPESLSQEKTDYRMIDEERKININKASATVLTSLLRDIGQLDTVEARNTAHALIDWRDPDSMAGEGGAEEPYYQFLSRPYECKDAPFEIPEELLLVKGITRETYNRIKPYITVYGDGAVNINSAGREVLEALGLSRPLVRKILSYRWGPDGAPATEDDGIFPDLTQMSQTLAKVGLTVAEEEELAGFVAEKRLTIQSPHYSFLAEGTVNGRSARILCVLKKGKGLIFRREL